jgi:DNA repair protein RadD
MAAETIRKAGQSVACIDGTMADGERDKILDAFRRRQFKYLCNVGVLTTGYDNPGIDGIVMLRPTKSPGLLLQIAGRGLRKDPRKTNCVFLDYGGNLSFWGPLDTIEESVTDKRKGKKGQAPTKVCPECDTVLPASATVCTTCGKEFPRALKHEEQASDAPVTSDTPIVHAVVKMYARMHRKPGKPETLRLDYCDQLGLPVASEWLGISAASPLGFHNKAKKILADWPGSPFRKVGDTLYAKEPDGQLRTLSTQDIVDLAATLVAPVSITTVRDGKYVRVIHRKYA